jgi:imidazole glycerol phosphate synthase subunit HisF
MLTKRIIPCLDIKNGRTVKGVNFVDLKDAGDPVELAKKYAETGADELVFLDISATEERRATLIDLVRKVAAAIIFRLRLVVAFHLLLMWMCCFAMERIKFQSIHQRLKIPI